MTSSATLNNRTWQSRPITQILAVDRAQSGTRLSYEKEQKLSGRPVAPEDIRYAKYPYSPTYLCESMRAKCAVCTEKMNEVCPAGVGDIEATST
jgi:hypothetical protein